MPKDKDDKSPTGKVDGRKNNVTPEHSRFKTGDIPNPAGCKGKAGAEKARQDAFEQAALHEIHGEFVERFATEKGNGLLEVYTKLLGQDFQNGVLGDDHKARARVMQKIESALAWSAGKKAALDEFIRTVQPELLDEIYEATVRGRLAPNVLPHPAHVKSVDGVWLVFGPVTAEQRDWWEHHKSALQFLACHHKILREEHRQRPTVDTAKWLEKITKVRRALMRKVPSGWNWREQIYTRGMQAVQAELNLGSGTDEEDGFSIAVTTRPPMREAKVGEDRIVNRFSWNDMLATMEAAGYHPAAFGYLDEIYPEPNDPDRLAA